MWIWSIIFLLSAYVQSSQSLDFDHFWTTNEINTYLKDVAFKYPNYTNLLSLGKTAEARDLWSIHITDESVKSGTKPVIIIEAGLRARDWVANMASLRLIQEFVEKTVEYESLLASVEWIIIPNINPDGFEYTHTTDRNWIKNRRINIENSSCAGVSLNRNFNSNWGSLASAFDVCADYYSGPWPNSESETIALSGLFDKYGSRVKSYVSLQTAGAFLLSPYFFTADIRPVNWEQQQKVGHTMRDEIFKQTSKSYEAFAAVNVFRTSGNSLDYASVMKSIPLPFTILLPAADSGAQHDHAVSEIEPIGKHMLVAMRVLGNYVAETFQ